MPTALEIKPSKDAVASGVENASSVAQGLAEALADTYRLLIKTHVTHWNVEGPLFYAIHNLTETQYNALFAAADVIAERMRAIGHLTPMSTKAVLSGSIVKDVEATSTAGGMCQCLADDHEAIALRLHALIEVAEKAHDPVTADLATARSAFHEKAAWMLRAIAKDH